jgi:hypothetical protein
MPDPTRPSDGAATETEWGQAVHDAVFTPRGVRVAGGASSSISAVSPTVAQLQLNTAVDDPGGWLAADTLTVPSGASGVYAFWVDVQTDNGDDDQRTLVELRRNGTAFLRWFMPQAGTLAVSDAKSGLIDLNAGDTINVYAGKSGGANPDVIVRALDILRQGSEVGA